MRNGSSSAVDQTGVPVYRGPATPRTSSKETMEDSNHTHHHHDAGLKARSSLDAPRDKLYAKDDEEMDHNHSKFRSRQSLPWYQSRELQIVGAITVLAAVVRLWAIGYPTSVVFDEVHFGGFASKYIRGRFFMDVHPPLAKMLIALTGWIFGLDPSFDFKDIGMDYIEPKVPYIPMRMMCGLMGVSVVPMAFYTVRNSGHSLHASILAALLVLFENSIAAQSRLILLDSPLILFTAFTALAWVNFHNQRHDPFSDDWFVWLFMTGLGLGLSGSVKWVGLFIIATIGTSTLNQLWTLWGDLKVSPRVWLNHFIARAICLIAVPVIVYMFMFEIHFLLLGNGGEGDGFMSAPFQMTLGHSLQDSPLGVAYGATVSIRHQGTQGGYLHSHPSNYETGSKQQQITLYPHKDTNNEWILQKRDGSIPEELEYIKHGDNVRLLHASTFKRLHSHDKKPPMTEDENHFEVSGYGYKGFEGDANDEWRVEIVDRDGSDPEASKSLHTLRSKFKLVHINMNCDLFSHKVKLPKWAFEQQEVTCMRSAVVGKTTWMIESNHHDSYPADAPLVNYKKPGFFGKFIELNKVMWTTNAGLTESHPYDSRPSSWPIMKRGISFWGKEQKHIYLVGNWFTWYLSTFAVVLYAAIRGLLFIRDKRGYKDDFKGLREYYELSGGFFFMGWCYHYLPFFLMDRQLFLHHYLPALYFSILLLAVTFDLACRFMPNRFRLLALILVASAAIYVFRSYVPLTYGSEWTKSECEASKVLSTWDYDCSQYPTEYSQYAANKPAVAPIENFDEQSNTVNDGGSGFLEQAVPDVDAANVPEIQQDDTEKIHHQQEAEEEQASPEAAAAAAEAEAAQITDKAVSNEDVPGAHLDEEDIEPSYDFEVDSPEEEEEEEDEEDDE